MEGLSAIVVGCGRVRDVRCREPVGGVLEARGCAFPLLEQSRVVHDNLDDVHAVWLKRKGKLMSRGESVGTELVGYTTGERVSSR